ncbi:Alpha/Beta hydrolase protein [Mycena olivaceomarginata]|nr:Alpha/Beta hydrolase protein [Mycena olivaceomarginata]
MTKPTIIVIPGSFSAISGYAAVIAEFEAHGYAVHGIELETVGRRAGKAPDMYADSAKVAALVSKLADEGKDVVLMPHSYGGIVALEASKGLAKSVRSKVGKTGGVARIVLVTAVAPLEGQTVKDLFGGALDFMKNEGGYLVRMDAPIATAVGFSNLPAEEAQKWAATMEDHSAESFEQKLTYAAYKAIPILYLFCEDDKLMLPELQNKLIAGLEGEMGGQKVDRHSVKSGHAIHASQPKAMVAVVRKAIGDTE